MPPSLWGTSRFATLYSFFTLFVNLKATPGSGIKRSSLTKDMREVMLFGTYADPYCNNVFRSADICFDRSRHADSLAASGSYIQLSYSPPL